MSDAIGWLLVAANVAVGNFLIAAVLAVILAATTGL